jgi:hypothetical protein
MPAVEIDQSKIPEGLGGARPVQLPATRYGQGGRVMYHVVVTLAGLTTVVVTRPDPNRPIEGNRRVDAARARKFGAYLLKNEDWVSPAVIVRAPSGEIQFEALKEFEDRTAWGVLSIPLHVLTEILLLDGQHRTLGTFLALDAINEQIAKTRDTIALAERNGGGEVIAEFKAKLKKQMATRDRLGKEHISVDIAVVTSDAAKQMFADINNNAKGVNPDYTTYLDQREVVNRIAVDLIDDHPLLVDRVEIGQSKRMSATNPNLMGAKTVADIIRAVHVGITGRIGRKVEDEMARNETAALQKVRSFLDLLVTSFKEMGDVMDGDLEPADLRRESLLGSATILRVLAATYHELTKRPESPGDPAPMSRSQIEAFFKALEPHMRDIPIKEKDKLWMPTGAFIAGTTAPQARRQSLKQLTDAMLDWARNGHPSLQQGGDR